jgi:hypothetical protein
VRKIGDEYRSGPSDGNRRVVGGEIASDVEVDRGG